mmetsp:Transcript_21757/g.43166  ORF Transcript_21757/g.43166 Transcript_21757/m.43166 type:complete len:606 (-) Transcript_21757:463-2280(-)
MWALYILGLAYFVQRAEGVFGGRPPNKWDVEASFVVPILDALSGEYICTGSILTSQHVMTAASCFVDLSSGVAKMVHRNSIVGVGASTTNSPEMKVHPVGQIKTHPSYNINNLKYHPADVVDLAVIRLQTHIAFGPNDKARAAVIATDETSHLLTQDRPAKNVIGFGITQLPRQGDTSPLQFSTTAQSAEVIIRSGDYCQWSSDIYHQNSLKRVTYFDSKYHLCATVASNRGACTGDVGAPLTFLGKAPMGTLPQNGRTVNVKTQDRPFIVGLYQGLAPGGECGRATIAADVLKALGMVDEKPVPDPNAPALPPSTPNYARFVNLLYWGPWVQAATGTVLPATYYVGKYVPPKKLPEFPPLVRQPASKCGRCPGQANAKDCWCDAECEKNGDCCADFIDSGCKKKIAGDQEKAVQGGAGCSAPGVCGFQSGACWCDADCASHGDCCSNFGLFCSSVPSNLAQSCVGKCGIKSNGCWCDPECEKNQDCCPDYNICSTIAPEGSGSCLGKCGFQSGSCWCDDACLANNDCCANYKSRCGKAGSCEGHCGFKSGEECWCDATCMRTGDCCPDFNAFCPKTKLSHEVEAAVLQNGRRRRRRLLQSPPRP